jgi:hypothetical protein
MNRLRTYRRAIWTFRLRAMGVRLMVLGNLPVTPSHLQ